MNTSYTGRCICGSVRVRVAAEPLTTRQCWCRQCQKIAAGGSTQNAIFKTADMEIEGAMSRTAWTAASGNTLSLQFCPACGTQIAGQSSAGPMFMSLFLGILDKPHGLRPESVIWTDDAPDWAVFDPELESWPQQPPLPPRPDKS